MTTDGPDSPHVDDTASPPPPAEARGPHLPDRWPVLVFVGLAIAAGWATYPNPPAWAPEAFIAIVLDLLPTVCAVLLPAALLLRHPDAPRIARPLFVGTLLVAAVPFLRLAAPQLDVFFSSLTPPPAEQDWFVPSKILFGFFHGLVGLFGVLYIALGLSQARHWAYRSSARVAGFAVFAVGIVASLATAYSGTQTDLSGVEMTPQLWAYLIGSIILSIVTILAWSYLAMSLVRSALSGEEPGLGWLAGALGTFLILVTFAIGAWANLVRTANETLTTVIFWGSNASYAIGFLLLFVAFLLGMPSLEPVEWGEDDADLDAEDDDEDAEPEPEPDAEPEPEPDAEPEPEEDAEPDPSRTGL